jgi:nucleotide-binding universal stress UspA family protein
MAARLLLGSVSRQVVRRATCPVLVVRGRRRGVARVVVGHDGSRNSDRAIGLLDALSCPPGGLAVVVRVIEPVRVPPGALGPAAGSTILVRQVAAVQADRVRGARRGVERAAAQLRTAGWRVRPVVRVGHPLPELLREVERRRADLLVIGAQGVSGVKRLLLGSVADGVLNRCRIPILLAR